MVAVLRSVCYNFNLNYMCYTTCSTDAVFVVAGKCVRTSVRHELPYKWTPNNSCMSVYIYE